MPERFLTFDEAQQRLRISADELQRLMDGREIHAVVEKGVVKLSESDVVKLARAAAGQSLPPGTLQPGFPTSSKPGPQNCPTCFTRPGKSQEDYGFVFLVDEGEEAHIEGEAYDGVLPTSTVQTPDEDARREDFVNPTELSAEQREALDLFSDMDMTRIADMGREIAERSGRTEQSPTLETPELADRPEPVAPKFAQSAPPPPAEPTAAEPPLLSEPSLHAPVLDFKTPSSAPVAPRAPEPVALPEAVELPSSEPLEPSQPMKLDFVTEEPPASAAKSEPSVDARELYDLAETGPEIEVTDRAFQATDEESQDKSEAPAPIAESIELVSQPMPAFESEEPQAPLADLETTFDLAQPPVPEVVPQPLPEKPAVIDLSPPRPAQSETKPPEPVAKPVPPAPVQPQKPPVQPVESVQIPAPEATSSLQADELFDEIERELESERVPVKETPPVGRRSPSGKPASPRDASQTVPTGRHAQSGQPDRPKPKSEEESVVPDNKPKKKDEKPAEDIFEVYDIDETEVAPPEAATPPEEEIVELEEVTEAHHEKAAIERTVDQEMADIFGEEAPPAEEAPAIADDFDLSIFKEPAAAEQDSGALAEVDLSAVTQETPSTVMGGPGALAGSAPSRVDYVTAEKGPSTAPVTIAILVSFLALVVAGMILVALYYKHVPGG